MSALPPQAQWQQAGAPTHPPPPPMQQAPLPVPVPVAGAVPQMYQAPGGPPLGVGAPPVPGVPPVQYMVNPQQQYVVPQYPPQGYAQMAPQMADPNMQVPQYAQPQVQMGGAGGYYMVPQGQPQHVVQQVYQQGPVVGQPPAVQPVAQGEGAQMAFQNVAPQMADPNVQVQQPGDVQAQPAIHVQPSVEEVPQKPAAAAYQAPGSNKNKTLTVVRRTMLGGESQSNSSDEGAISDSSSDGVRKCTDRAFFGCAMGQKQQQQQQQQQQQHQHQPQQQQNQPRQQNRQHPQQQHQQHHHKGNDPCPFSHRKSLHMNSPGNPQDIAQVYNQWRQWWDTTCAANPLGAPSIRGARNHHIVLDLERRLLAHGVPQINSDTSEKEMHNLARLHSVSKKDLQKVQLLKHLSFNKELAQNFNFEPYGLQVQKEVLTQAEEQNALRRLADEHRDWDDDLQTRRTLQFGYHFDYSTDNLCHFKTEVPEWLQHLSKKVAAAGDFDKIPNQVIINEYIPKQGILLHADRHCFGEYICSVSLQSDITMCFANSADNLSRDEADVGRGKAVLFHLPPRAMLAMTSQARWKWQHGIAGSKYDFDSDWNITERTRRVSLTFRYVDPVLWEQRRTMMKNGQIDPEEERRTRAQNIKSKKAHRH